MFLGRGNARCRPTDVLTNFGRGGQMHRAAPGTPIGDGSQGGIAGSNALNGNTPLVRQPPVAPASLFLGPEHVPLRRHGLALALGHARQRAVGWDDLPDQPLVSSRRDRHHANAHGLRQGDRDSDADVLFDLMS